MDKLRNLTNYLARFQAEDLRLSFDRDVRTLEPNGCPVLSRSDIVMFDFYFMYACVAIYPDRRR